MSLQERVINSLKERKQRLIDGKINSVPSPFVRFRKDFLGIEQGKYYLITASTKASKTQFMTYLFLCTTLDYAYNHPDQMDVHIMYFPLEETPEDIMTRYMSHLLYQLSGRKIRISPTDLTSANNDKPVSDDILALLETEEYKNRFKFFEEHVVFSSTSNPTGIYKEVKEYLQSKGTIHYKEQKIKNDFGQQQIVQAFDYYVPNNPEQYNIFIVDHVSLLHQENNLTLKQTVDKMSEYCVELRNRYRAIPVIVQQQAFAGESLDAFKENKLRPTTANLADSKYTSRDCNVAFGLFSPMRHELRTYMGYDIVRFKDSIRFVEILVNRGGIMGGIVALYFDGATDYFAELPNPKDITNLNRVYNLLDMIHEEVNVSLVLLTNKLKTKTKWQTLVFYWVKVVRVNLLVLKRWTQRKLSYLMY